MRLLSLVHVSFALFCASNGYPHRTIQRALPEDQEAEPSESFKSTNDDSDMYMEALENDESETKTEDPSHDSQNFYPSFSSYNDQPLGHSRPFYYQPDAAYSHRPTAYQQHVGYASSRISGYKGDYYEDRSPNENSILGSGNFGVIKGGTFYNDKDGESDEFEYNGRYPFYHNGHGRPSFYYGNNRRPTQREQFENFRDFADINTPSYSHFVVVYANRNGTKKEENKESQPKNILEHLALLDLESNAKDDESTEESITTTEASGKKVSKAKAKLAKLFAEKKAKLSKQKMGLPSSTQNSRDLYEPLLALS